MKKIFFFLFILPLIGIVSCNGESEEDPTEDSFNSVKTIIDTAYPPIDEYVLTVMDKLQICTLSDTVLHLPPCNNELFRVFKYKPDKDWKAGFIIEMVPGLYGSPVHQIVVVDEFFGKFTIVNQYLGRLLEMRTTVEGYNDLLIGYDDPDIGLVAIRHKWTVNKYDLVDVEEINNHFVKPEMKDSINNIFLPAFAAGH